MAKIIRGLGNPTPPLDLRIVRDLLRLDRAYYSTTDDSVLRETFSRLKVAGIQVLKRPTLLADAVRTLSLKALYLPDQKRILLDQDLPQLKHRWNEAHEIGHDIIPWHEGMMLGDTLETLTPSCHEIMEAEANYAAGQLLFLGGRFVEEAASEVPSLVLVRKLGGIYGNTITSTLWRLTEQASKGRPIIAMVSGHPHRFRRNADFDPANPCRYFIQSPEFRDQFGSITESQLFSIIAGYCGSQSGGLLGQEEIILADRNGERHLFVFETFFNRYEALTLGVWSRAQGRAF
ncbi:ImmA/IrrE family metallo-endopeptidase [Sphingomonas asaccharolytica]|uniref:ImmA/IrrE family metallo-endopeptidase n=1 Tax=Sphingomonas asaccharolytica TaxID=40681 RepID=UPI000B20DF25|nr:ImmA/IrrE family metallo-endopeptidase [Sphingomonas asaccharolytica]